jgi:hypothetical protein
MLVPVNRESAKRRARRWGVQLEVSFLFSVKSVVRAMNNPQPQV